MYWITRDWKKKILNLIKPNRSCVHQNSLTDTNHIILTYHNLITLMTVTELQNTLKLIHVSQNEEDDEDSSDRCFDLKRLFPFTPPFFLTPSIIFHTSLILGRSLGDGDKHSSANCKTDFISSSTFFLPSCRSSKSNTSFGDQSALQTWRIHLTRPVSPSPSAVFPVRISRRTTPKL